MKGQSWVTSPLGRNLLLGLFKDNIQQNVDKYRQIGKVLEKKDNFKFSNRVFQSKSTDVKAKLSSTVDVEEIDFNDIQTASTIVTSWVNKYATLVGFSTKVISSNTDVLLANMSIFNEKWNSSSPKGAFMKVYNSFSYTEDIKYEARLLELPMHDDDFKLVILVPNEADVLNNLFNKLTKEGLTAATGGITPLFTSISELNAPNVEFTSQTNEIQNFDFDATTLAAIEFGNVKINEQGVSIKVLTCFTSGVQREVTTSDKLFNKFFFAVVFKDMPIFTGHYESINK